MGEEGEGKQEDKRKGIGDGKEGESRRGPRVGRGKSLSAVKSLDNETYEFIC